MHAKSHAARSARRQFFITAGRECTGRQFFVDGLEFIVLPGTAVEFLVEPTTRRRAWFIFERPGNLEFVLERSWPVELFVERSVLVEHPLVERESIVVRRTTEFQLLPKPEQQFGWLQRVVLERELLARRVFLVQRQFRT